MTIYFIEMEGSRAIKIGFTAADDVEQRMRQLQTGQPNKLSLLGCIAGDQTAERALHAEFAHYRTNGEWFEGPPVFRRFLTYMAENNQTWTFCRAYRMFEDFLGELTDEMERLKARKTPASVKGSVDSEIAWRDKQIHRQHRRMKEQERLIAALEEQMLCLQSNPSVSSVVSDGEYISLY